MSKLSIDIPQALCTLYAVTFVTLSLRSTAPQLDFLADVMNGYGGAVDFLHDVDMENLYFGNGDDDDFFDPDYDDQLDFLVRIAVKFGYFDTAGNGKSCAIGSLLT